MAENIESKKYAFLDQFTTEQLEALLRGES